MRTMNVGTCAEFGHDLSSIVPPRNFTTRREQIRKKMNKKRRKGAGDHRPGKLQNSRRNYCVTRRTFAQLVCLVLLRRLTLQRLRSREEKSSGSLHGRLST